MSDVTIVQADPPAPVESPATVVEAPAEAPTNENDVAIAVVEAERDVALGEQQKDARIAEADAYKQSLYEKDQELEQCRTDISRLQNELAETKALLLAQSAPISSTEPEAETTVIVADPEAVEELIVDLPPQNNSTPQSTSAETSETLTEAIQSVVEEGPDLPPLVSVGRKPIVKLV